MTTETKLSKIPEEIFTTLKEGIQSILNDKDWAGFLKVLRKMHHYSFNNRFLIYLEQERRGYGHSSFVAGFKKWKTEFNRTVKKGEKSIHILAPVMYTVTDDSGNVLLNDEGKPIRRPYKFKTAHVFDHHQTEGEPITSPDISDMLSPLEGEIPDELFNGLVKVASEHNVRTEENVPKSKMEGALGSCWFTGEKADRIKLVEGLNAATKVSVMSHELGHALLHGANDYRRHTPGSIKELEAESVAYLVCSYYNIDLGQRTFKYIVLHNTATDDVVEELSKSGERIFKAYEKIVKRADQWIKDNTY